MSNEAKNPRTHEQKIAALMNSNTPKNELEWAAVEEIKALREEIGILESNIALLQPSSEEPEKPKKKKPLKVMFQKMAWAFFIIVATSIVVGDNLGVDPLILATAFLFYYKASKDLGAAIQAAHDYNKQKGSNTN